MKTLKKITLYCFAGQVLFFLLIQLLPNDLAYGLAILGGSLLFIILIGIIIFSLIFFRHEIYKKQNILLAFFYIVIASPLTVWALATAYYSVKERVNGRLIEEKIEFNGNLTTKNQIWKTSDGTIKKYWTAKGDNFHDTLKNWNKDSIWYFYDKNDSLVKSIDYRKN